MSGIAVVAVWLFFCHNGVLRILITQVITRSIVKKIPKAQGKSNFVADFYFNVLESAKVIFKITAGESVTSAGLSQALVCCFGVSMPSDHELPLSLLSACMSELTFFCFSKRVLHVPPFIQL